MPDDKKLDELIRQHGAGYRSQPPVPAEALWRRMERDVARAIAPPQRRVWLLAGAAVAAALILGIGIGRWTGAPVRNVAAAGDDSLHRAAYLRAAAYDHLGESEVFLTEVRADLRAGRGDTDRAARSRELLTRTRLLLQSRGQSPDVTRLLEDLELLLAEIAALPDSGKGRAADDALLEETLKRNDIIPRIRTTVPARGI